MHRTAAAALLGLLGVMLLLDLSSMLQIKTPVDVTVYGKFLCQGSPAYAVLLNLVEEVQCWFLIHCYSCDIGICLYMHLCINACIYECMCVCLFVFMYIGMYVGMYVGCLYTCIQAVSAYVVALACT